MRVRGLLAAVICVMLLPSCAETSYEAERAVYAMDTVMTLKAYGLGAENALDEAEKEIARLDSALRRGSEDSEIYRINTQESAEVSDETAEIIGEALDICNETDGAFDISIAPLMDLWGFYTKNFYVPSEKEIARELDRVKYKNIIKDGNTVSVTGGSEIDLGGIAKGYLSDRIMKIFKDNGVDSGIISLGGNVQTLGKKTDGSAWRVAIQNPDNDSYIGCVSVSDMAVITSGGYQRFFEQDGKVYHHIIDPKTGRPAESGLKSVTIVSSNGTLADGLSTAIFVMGLDEGTEYWRGHEGFDVIFVTEDAIYITEGLDGIFESEYDYSVIYK